MMTMQIELEKSSMAFKLEDGSILLISKSDVTELANKLILEMMINNQNSIYMLKDNALERCSLLYKIVTQQGDTMSKSTKENYLKTILVFLNDKDDVGFQTLKDKIENEN